MDSGKTMVLCYLNVRNVKYAPNNFINAALAGIGDGHNGGGPIWAIFDAALRARYKCRISAYQCPQRGLRRPCDVTTPLLTQASMPTSARHNRATRSRSRHSMPHGLPPACTTLVRACASMRAAR